MTDGADEAVRRTRASYDRVAVRYAAEFRDELTGKPLDRALLDCVAAEVTGAGRTGDPRPVLDVGCGPGHVAGYLRDRGVPAMVGVDLSPRMVALAGRLHPGPRFAAGSMLALPVADGACAAAVALYSIIHLRPADRAPAYAEFARVLAPGAPLLVGFHAGTQVVHLDAWWDHEVALDFHFLDPAEVTAGLTAAGLPVEARLERRPYPTEKNPTSRCYLLARKP